MSKLKDRLAEIDAKGFAAVREQLIEEEARTLEAELEDVQEDDLPASTAEEWVEKNTARDLAFFSKRARSGRDPQFTLEFMKQTMGLLTARAKARIDGTATVLASQNGDKKLMEAAKSVGNLSQGALMSMLRDIKA